VRVVVGDMVFEDNVRCFSGGSQYERNEMIANENRRSQEALNSFLKVAERLYKKQKDENTTRTTIEEF